MAFTAKELERYVKLRIRADDPSSAASERETARVLAAKMEVKYPGIRDAGEAWRRAQSGGASPGPATGAPSGPSGRAGGSAGAGQSGSWGDLLRDWFVNTVDQVTRGLSVTDSIEKEVPVTVTVKPKFVYIAVKIPIESMESALSRSGAEPEEYCRLVGQKTGRELHNALAPLFMDDDGDDESPEG
jgi:hypothetical protein